jgi:hypothetical protein
VFVWGDNSTFTMGNDAVISGNTAGNTGGGVAVESGGSFTKTGGVIYGSEAAANLKNVVTGQTDKGAAVYVDPTHRRENTVSANLSVSGSTYDGQWTA